MNIPDPKTSSEKEKLKAELNKIKQEILRKAQEGYSRKRDNVSGKHKDREQSWKLANNLFNINRTEDGESSKSERSAKLRKQKISKREEQKVCSTRTSASSDAEECYNNVKTNRKVIDPSTDKQVSQKERSSLVREEWMVDRMLLPTYCKEKQVIKNHTEHTSYDPCTSSRELNPYWKNGGHGTPSFKIPGESKLNRYNDGDRTTAKKNWQKSRQETRGSEGLKSKEISQNSKDLGKSWEGTYKLQEFSSVQEKDLNKLGAQILKAEMMGDFDQMQTLKKKLEYMKNQRKKPDANSERDAQLKVNQNTDEDYVLLSTTSEFGVVRPLPKHTKSTITSAKSVTANMNAERFRFHDDDRYDLKNMFETEKHATSSSSNAEFLEMISRQKRKADDMDDIFVDQIRKTNKSDNKSTEKAIREHEAFVKILDSCDKCFYSMKLDREFIVSEGSHVYLAIPWHEGLQKYHCLIIPKEHISCSTRLDENVWSEITAFRKALCRTFEEKAEQCIFFETAVNLQRKPHCVIHCVPGKNFDVMPLYFKKAILESEKDWSINKQLITLKEKDLRRAIPKELPYFWVNFGMQNGFAHVIEDQTNFQPNFAQEIIGNFLELEPSRWRRPRGEKNHLRKVKQFIELWKHHDITRNLEP